MSRTRKSSFTPNIAMLAFVSAVSLQQGYGASMGYEAASYGATEHSNGGDFECAVGDFLVQNNTKGELILAGSLPVGIVLGYLFAKPGDVETTMFDANKSRCMKLGYR